MFNQSTPSTAVANVLNANLSRRKFLRTTGVVAAGIAGAGALAACAGNSGSGPAAPSEENLLAGKPTGTVRVGCYQDPAFALFPTLLFPAFEKETGVKVEWLPQDYNTWYEKAVNDAQSQAGAFDVYILDDPWMPQFASNGLVRNLSKSGFSADPDIVGPAIETAYWPPRSGPVPPDQRGKSSELYSLPVQADTPILCYRKDIYGDTPTTFDRIVEVARQQGDPAAGKYGWVFRGAKGNPVVTAWFPTLYTFGGQFFDDSWNIQFNNPTAVKAFEFQLSLLQYCPPNLSEFDSDQEGAAFLNGQAFAANMWTGWAANSLDPAKSKVTDKVGFGIPPRIDRPASELGIQLAAIPHSAPNPTGAAALVQWLSSKDTQLLYARNGGTPTRASAFADPAAKAKIPYLGTVADTLAVATARARTPLWSQIEDLLGTQLNSAIAQGPGASAAQYLNDAAAQATQVLKQAGYLQ